MNGIRLHYEEAGQGAPLVFVHEFAGEAQSWHLQVRSSPAGTGRSSSTRAATPVGRADGGDRVLAGSGRRGHPRLLDALGIDKAHVCGLSMGGYATLHFGLRHPGRARSLVVAGAGTGAWRRSAQVQAGRPPPPSSGS